MCVNKSENVGNCFLWVNACFMRRNNAKDTRNTNLQKGERRTKKKKKFCEFRKDYFQLIENLQSENKNSLFFSPETMERGEKKRLFVASVVGATGAILRGVHDGAADHERHLLLLLLVLLLHLLLLLLELLLVLLKRRRRHRHHELVRSRCVTWKID
jgi:hypothetical protein